MSYNEIPNKIIQRMKGADYGKEEKRVQRIKS